MQHVEQISANTIPYFVSWSGGKDSYLALHRAIQKYGKPKLLLNMLTEDGNRSRSHGLTKAILEKQAHLLQIPIRFYSASWNQYEFVYSNALRELKKEGIEMGVFGDIKIPEHPDWTAHRQWADQMCEQAGLSAYEPLWEDSTESLLENMFDLAFVANIISVKADLLSADDLGKTLDKNLLLTWKEKGINPLGEKGEYHTIVSDGSLFTEPLPLQKGKTVLRDGYWFLDVY